LVGLGFGLDGNRLTGGSGKVMLSSTIGLLGSHSVLPVVVPFRPTMAAMSPASTSVDVLALISLHTDDAADALFFAGGAVQDIAAGCILPE
jgi:hypothetical protein